MPFSESPHADTARGAMAHNGQQVEDEVLVHRLPEAGSPTRRGDHDGDPHGDLERLICRRGSTGASSRSRKQGTETKTAAGR